MKSFGAVSYHERETCRFCDSTELELYLDLGVHPPSNSFITPAELAHESAFPLRVFLCRKCSLSQLVDIVSAEDIFDDYAYLSSSSKALCQHYQGLVAGLLMSFTPADGSLIVDIGCNDGIMLNCYPRERFGLVGVEPSSAGDVAAQQGHLVIPEFFDTDLADQMVASHGNAAIVTVTNVFAHVDNTRDFACGLARLLGPDGVVVFEFPYLVDMIQERLFDTVYHEHLGYLSLTPLIDLFERVGLRAFNAQRIEIGASGPALRLFACRVDSDRATDPSLDELRSFERDWGINDIVHYQRFAQEVGELRDSLRQLVQELRREGHRVGAFTAPAKGNTLLNYAGFTSKDIELVAENNALKIGKLTPGSHIPIVSDREFLDSGVSHALLLSWNYADFFLARSEFVRRGGRFIIPVPEPVIRP